MSNISNEEEAFTRYLLDNYPEPEELLTEVSSFYCAILSLYGINNFNLEMAGGATLSGTGIVDEVKDTIKSKPDLKLVH